MRHSPPLPSGFTTVFDSGGPGESPVTVSVSLYNYQLTILEALESVDRQSVAKLDLVVVDDASTDRGLEQAVGWAERNQARFPSVRIVRNNMNSGLARTRNLGFELAGSEFVFVLDADNVMFPRCLERLLEGITGTDLSVVWGIGQVFGAESRLISATKWDPDRLAHGPYIDASALVRRDAWLRVGGYREMPAMGWEDYDLYCRIHEHGLAGQVVPEITWSYRAHGKSMLSELDESAYTELRRWMMEEHPWLKLQTW